MTSRAERQAFLRISSVASDGKDPEFPRHATAMINIEPTELDEEQNK